MGTVNKWQGIRDDFMTFLRDMPQDLIELIQAVAA